MLAVKAHPARGALPLSFVLPDYGRLWAGYFCTRVLVEMFSSHTNKVHLIQCRVSACMSRSDVDKSLCSVKEGHEMWFVVASGGHR